jgi:hypothetical protein
MRLEYNEEQERKLRITDIEAILENDLFADADEEAVLVAELAELEAAK